MRIGRGHRDHRDNALKAYVRALLKRTHNNHGNPFISRVDLVRLQNEVLRRAARDDMLQRIQWDGVNYHRLRSANQGYTVVIKDNIVTVELPTTCASKILKGFRPAETSTVSHLLKQAGTVGLAKTNMDEFGMGSHTTNSAHGPSFNGGGVVRNQLSVGGSSGGSALAVARDLAHISIGTDTGGSVRLPAAYMSLVGFKPSYGLISRLGVVPYANSLDTVGIIAKSVLDAALTFSILQEEPDDRDPTCLNRSTRLRLAAARHRRRRVVLGTKVYLDARMFYYDPRDYRQTEPHKHTRFNHEYKNQLALQHQRTRRVGVPIEYNIEEMHPLVRWAWVATLTHLQKNHQCEIVPISLPYTKQALSAYYVLAPAEASSNLAKYDGVRYGAPRTAEADADSKNPLYSQYRHEHFGPEVRRRILLGTYTLSAGAMDNYFLQAQKVRRLVQKDFDAVFRMPNPLHDNREANIRGVDVILVPTAPTPPPYLETLESQTPVQKYMNDVFTVPASLAGLPALSVPGPPHPDHPWSPEVATSMQIIGQFGDDASVMVFARRFLEDFHPYDMRRTMESKLF